MPGRNRATFLTAGLAAATVGASVGMPRAQEAEAPTPSLIFSIGERLEVSDNPDGVEDPEEAGVYLRTDAGLAYLSETQVSTLSFGLDAGVESGQFGDGQGFDNRLDTLGSALSYTWTSTRAELTFGAAYRRVRLDDDDALFDVLLDDEFEDEDLIPSGGYRETRSASLGLTLGRDMPLGFALGLDYLDIDYEDAPDSEPRRSYGGEAAVRFTVSPVLDLGVVARADREERDDEEDYENEERTLALTASYAASPILSLSGEIGKTRSETMRTTIGGTRFTETTEGVTVGASAELARPNGTIGVAVESGLDENSRRNVVQVFRTLEYPLGELAFSLGASQQEGGDVSPVGSLNYSRETARGAFTVAYDQSISTDDDSDRIRSRLALAYEQQINNVSSWRASVDYASVEFSSGAVEDDETSRIGASLAYRRDITQDWVMTAGYRHDLTDDGDADERRSNTVFLGVSRDFVILP
jgi:hypothetical protein